MFMYLLFRPTQMEVDMQDDDVLRSLQDLSDVYIFDFCKYISAMHLFSSTWKIFIFFLHKLLWKVELRDSVEYV